MASIALQHREQILERVAAGEYLASIAQSLGLKGKGQAISNALASDPEYHAVRELGLEAILARREAEIERSEREDVPRARELLSHARWRAERECAHRWGAKQTIDVTHTLRVEQRLERDLSALLGRVVEGETVAQGPHDAVDALCKVQENNASPSAPTSLDALAAEDEHEQQQP